MSQASGDSDDDFAVVALAGVADGPAAGDDGEAHANDDDSSTVVMRSTCRSTRASKGALRAGADKRRD